ncbi:MAG: YARHG domain-containing protein [Oscillospiraceae bacterium]|nr:YARHG domain-containing protein [Oscillospiraceae bacterium]
MRRILCILFAALLLMSALAGCGIREMMGGKPAGQQEQQQADTAAAETVEEAKPPLTAIACYPSELEMYFGDTSEIKTVFTPADPDSTELIWSTTNPSVATVSNGIVFAVGAGNCKITAASAVYANVSKDVSVTVKLKDEDVQNAQDAAQGSAQASDSGNTYAPAEMTRASADKVYPNTYLSDSELRNLSRDELQFIINQIYAKNGYIFSNSKIQSYFSQLNWYTPVTSDPNALRMSSMDRSNLALLTQYRAAREDKSSTEVGYIWSYSKVQNKLSESFVSGLSQYDVQLLINTIYARNGYIFSTPEIADIFKGQPWYSGRTKNESELNFSSTDKYNLDLLVKYQD